MALAATHRGGAGKALATFFVIFVPLTAFFEFATVRWNYGNWITGMMWSVGIAAILTCFAIGRPVASLGWSWGPTKYQLMALLIPMAYALLSCLTVWGLRLAKYDAAAVRRLVSTSLGMPFVPDVVAPVVLVAVIGFTSIAGSIASALGEEIGWRGFLAPELAKVMPFIAACLVTGVIWGLWHFPILFGGGYHAAHGLTPVDAVKFIAATTLATIPMTWLRLRSGSLWTGAIFHGAHNLFLNSIFTLMVADGPGKALIGELGPVTLAWMGAFAALFWWRARRDFLPPGASRTPDATAT